MLELTKAGTSDALVLNSISKRAFHSDIVVGASSKTGPPGYMLKWQRPIIYINYWWMDGS